MQKDDGSNPWSVKWASTVLNYYGQISGSPNLASQTPTAARGFRPPMHWSI